ncbi:hypothetical protein [Microbacterium istanbulense]|uniref:Nuclear transport factor 2 family protein n=1 Tax=Microbacterium istanbulense TaxID=3122049 RepID=A0ABU8LJW0_9MICO
MTHAAASPRFVGALCALTLSIGVLAACTPAPEPTPTATALFASDEEAFAAAEETYRAYTEALNEVDTSKPQTFEAVYKYTTGDFQNRDRKNFSTLHAERFAMTGDSQLVRFEGLKFDNESTITAEICVDVSKTDVINQDGVSMVPDDRPDVSGAIVKFELDDDEVRIARADRLEPDTCVAG